MPDFKTRSYFYCFNGVMLVYVAGLLFRGAWGPALLAALAPFSLYLVTKTAPPDRVGLLEGLAYPVVMTLFFFGSSVTIPMIRPGIKYDQMLQAIDQRYLFNIEAWVASVSRPWLTDLITVCYLLYGPLLYSSLIYFAFFRKDLGLAFYSGLFTIFSLGFIGYLAVPAEGPHFARFSEVMPLIVSGPFHTFADPLIKGGCTRADVFPSLHIAISAYCLGFMFSNTRRLFWFWLLPVAGLAVATLYLFYHYQVDVLAGLAVSIIALTVAGKVLKRTGLQAEKLGGNAGQSFIKHTKTGI